MMGYKEKYEINQVNCDGMIKNDLVLFFFSSYQDIVLHSNGKIWN
jgi:hypothetical protein